jgi:glutamate-1-semialdehyde 2,1-aminomutase
MTIAAVNLRIQCMGSIFWLAFTDSETTRSAEEIDPKSMEKFRILYHELLGNGVYLGPSGYEVGFVSEAHTYAQLDATIEAFSKSLKKLN